MQCAVAVGLLYWWHGGLPLWVDKADSLDDRAAGGRWGDQGGGAVLFGTAEIEQIQLAHHAKLPSYPVAAVRVLLVGDMCSALPQLTRSSALQLDAESASREAA